MDPRTAEDVDHERLDRGHRNRLGAHRDGEIRGFIVEKGAPGFSAPDIQASSRCAPRSRRSSCSRTFASPGRDAPRGRRRCAARSRASTRPASGSSGASSARAARASRRPSSYAKERIVFGKPISAYQLTQQKLAEMALEVNRGFLVALHIGRMKDQGHAAGARARQPRQDGQRPAARSTSVARRARSWAATASPSSTP